MQEFRHKRLQFFVIILLVLIVSPCYGILNPGKVSEIFDQLCYSRGLIFTCECTANNQVLNVSTFHTSNVQTNVDRITIKNCDAVTIGANSIEFLKSLRYFEILNVNNLSLEQFSLFWAGYEPQYLDYLAAQPGLNILIKSTKINNISQYAVKGRSVELKLENSIFEKIESFAFSSLTNMRNIEIKNCTFNQINGQAFKKIETENFAILNSHFKFMSSRSFADIIVTENFKLFKNYFDLLNPTTFIIKQPKKSEILSNTFANLFSESFKISTRGPVLIKNNLFYKIDEHAFSGINLLKENRAQQNENLQFDNNTLPNFNSLHFNRTSFNPSFGIIYINITCDCINLELVLKANYEYTEYVQCIIDRRKLIYQKAIEFKTSQCALKTNTWLILVIVFTILLILIIIIGIVVFYLYRRYKLKKQEELVNRGRTKNGSVGLIVPDGRTYRETEVHVIIEKAELLTTEL